MVHSAIVNVQKENTLPIERALENSYQDFSSKDRLVCRTEYLSIWSLWQRAQSRGSFDASTIVWIAAGRFPKSSLSLSFLLKWKKRYEKKNCDELSGEYRVLFNRNMIPREVVCVYSNSWEASLLREVEQVSILGESPLG